MLENIEKIIIPSLKTNHVALFNCFGDQGFSDLLFKYHITPDAVKNLTASLQDPMWRFITDNMEGYDETKSNDYNQKHSEAIGSRRSPEPNHFLDSDVVPFWNHYKGTLQKLCLDNPPYK